MFFEAGIRCVELWLQLLGMSWVKAQCYYRLHESAVSELGVSQKKVTSATLAYSLRQTRLIGVGSAGDSNEYPKDEGAGQAGGQAGKGC